MQFRTKILFLAPVFVASFTSCAKDPLLGASSAKALYVASGLCYSGNGITTFNATTSSNMVYKVDLATGTPGEIIADYNLSSAVPGSSPVSIHSKDATSIWVIVENVTAGARRIESATDSATLPTYFYTNATAFSGVLRKSAFDSINGAFIVNKTTALERINMSPGRDLAGANPWVNNPAGNCAGTNTLITASVVLPNGNILYGHASTTAGNRKLSIVSATGYKTAADCLITAAVTVPSYITDIVYLDGAGQILVSMADSTTGNNMNSIYVYDIDPTTSAITNGQSLLENNSSAGTKFAPYLYGATSMAYDSAEGVLYVAMANSVATTVQNYKIEKFRYDSTAKTLTRVGTTPWSPSWAGSKCISSMLIK